jgi:hypothetical protein
LDEFVEHFSHAALLDTRSPQKGMAGERCVGGRASAADFSAVRQAAWKKTQPPTHRKAALLGARRRRGTAAESQAFEAVFGGGFSQKHTNRSSNHLCIIKTFVQISISSPSSSSNPKNSINASFASLRSFDNIAKMRFKRCHIRGLCGCDFVALKASVSVF